MTIKMKDVREALVEMVMQGTWVLQHCREDALLDEVISGELSLKMKAITEMAIEFRTPPVTPADEKWSCNAYRELRSGDPDEREIDAMMAEREGGR